MTYKRAKNELNSQGLMSQKLHGNLKPERRLPPVTKSSLPAADALYGSNYLRASFPLQARVTRNRASMHNRTGQLPILSERQNSNSVNLLKKAVTERKNGALSPELL